MFKCLCCGRELLWMCDYDVQEIFPEEKEGSGMVDIYTCDSCRVDYEITTRNKEEYIDIRFYNRVD